MIWYSTLHDVRTKLHEQSIITEEDNAFVASNPDTGVTSQGASLGEALSNLKEALELYLEELGSDAKKNLPNFTHSFLTTITI
jgi:predicted RNase H-like HicB family nuclease